MRRGLDSEQAKYSWREYRPDEDSQLDDFDTRYGTLTCEDARRMAQQLRKEGEIMSDRGPAMVTGIYTSTEWDSDLSWDEELRPRGMEPKCKADIDKVISTLRDIQMEEADPMERARLDTLIKIEQQAIVDAGYEGDGDV